MMKPKSNDYDRPGLLEYLEEIMQITHFKEELKILEEDFIKIEEERNDKN